MRRQPNPATATAMTEPPTPARPNPKPRRAISSRPVSKLQDLIALAKEPSSDKRRELLREVTDLFFVNPEHGGGELALFDDVLSQLAGEMEAAVRAELATRIAPAPDAPRKLVRGLAADGAIEVARPILEASKALTDEDLLFVAQSRGQEHLQAISRRDAVSQSVSEVIVERADDETLGVLLRNEGVDLSRPPHEPVAPPPHPNPPLPPPVAPPPTLPA